MRATFLLGLVCALATPDIVTYEEWKAEFRSSRTFTLAEHQLNDNDEYRRTIYDMNVLKIIAQNAQYLENTSGYKFGVNQFSDLTEEEFGKVVGLIPFIRKPKEDRNDVFLEETDVKAIDWRTKNAVTPVKNQGQCGSCWSFSASGAVEGAVAVGSGTLVSLSEKQLMDCSRKYGNNSCNGGLMDYAFQYVVDNGGLTSEENYPYEPRDGTCQTSKASQVVASISGYQDVPQDNVDQMLAAVSSTPVSVAIEADRSAFQSYNGGVLDKYSCGTNLDHGVLVVGYTEVDDPTYPNAWIVKNSWGSTWGVQGYIYISREVQTTPKGICGILESASYPTGGSSPNPPPPNPKPTPAPGSKFYENPYTGACSANEFALTLSDIDTVNGRICAPTCNHDTVFDCPKAPEGVTATPACIISSTLLAMDFCGLECHTYDNSCGSEMACRITCDTGTNVCKYACVYEPQEE